MHPVRDRRAAQSRGGSRRFSVIRRGGRRDVPHGPLRETQGGCKETSPSRGRPSAPDAILRGHLQHHRRQVRAGTPHP